MIQFFLGCLTGLWLREKKMWQKLNRKGIEKEVILEPGGFSGCSLISEKLVTFYGNSGWQPYFAFPIFCPLRVDSGHRIFCFPMANEPSCSLELTQVPNDQPGTPLVFRVELFLFLSHRGKINAFPLWSVKLHGWLMVSMSCLFLGKRALCPS